MFFCFRQNYGISLVRITGTVLTLFFIFFSLYNPPLLNELRLRIFDSFLRLKPAPLASTPIIIVDIDSKSLKAFGQWPWSRNLIAELLDKITAGKPTVVGLDMLFAEPDRSSPNRIADRHDVEDAPVAVRKYLRELPDYDLSLAKALYTSPVPVIIGYAFTHSTSVKRDEKNTLKKSNFIFLGGNPIPFLHPFIGVDSNLRIFEKAAQGSGFFNIVPDHDSITRSIPLVVNFEQQVYPSLVLSMIHAGERSDYTMKVEVDQRIKENGVRAVQSGSYRIPTTIHGELIIYFSGPAQTFTYI
jgi:adenylate cyclase